MVERLVLRNYLTGFLFERDKFVKQVAESEMWREYLSKAQSFLEKENMPILSEED